MTGHQLIQASQGHVFCQIRYDGLLVTLPAVTTKHRFGFTGKPSSLVIGGTLFSAPDAQSRFDQVYLGWVESHDLVLVIVRQVYQPNYETLQISLVQPRRSYKMVPLVDCRHLSIKPTEGAHGKHPRG